MNIIEKNNIIVDKLYRNTLKTPLGNIKVKINQEDKVYPCVELYICDDEGNEIECICITEYNALDDCISIYSFKENEENFDNKTIYKKGNNSEEDGL